MPVVDVINQRGEKVGAAELDARVFEAEVREELVQRVVVWQLAKRRSGCASTKTRGQTRGGGKKPWRQKGTGRARAGTTRSPLWPGGGTVFGPHPRNYAFALPKKIRRAALCSVLSDRLARNRLTVVDKIELNEPKTKVFLDAVNGMGIADNKAVIITPARDETLLRSSRNLYRYLVLPCAGLNVYDLLRYERVVILQDSLDAIHSRLSQ
jgi:large subunit ribosomal protein L4